MDQVRGDGDLIWRCTERQCGKWDIGRGYEKATKLGKKTTASKISVSSQCNEQYEISLIY